MVQWIHQKKLISKNKSCLFYKFLGNIGKDLKELKLFAKNKILLIHDGAWCLGEK